MSTVYKFIDHRQKGIDRARQGALPVDVSVESAAEVGNCVRVRAAVEQIWDVPVGQPWLLVKVGGK